LKKTISIILVVILLISASIHLFLSDALYTATGFSAKNICSGHFISGFSGELVVNEGLLPVHDTFSYVNYDIDDEQQEVITNAFGLYSRKAVYTEGIGCTLLAIAQDESTHKITKLAATVANDSSSNDFASIKPNFERPHVNYKRLEEAISAAFQEPDDLPNRRTKAIVVFQQGELISEKYADGIDSNTPLLSWSMAKSITNMQVGLLVKDERLQLNAPAPVPEWKDRSELHQQITLDQLLRMSSGLEFNEFYGIGSDASLMLSVEPNASEFAADKPVVHQPDTFWSYSSGTSNIIAGIVKQAIGGDLQNYYEYTQRKLFRPLGIYSAQLEADAKGTFIGSSYMYATARDWAKLGQLFLQDGIWNGKRILPEGWVKYSITPTKTNPLNNFGAHWWLNRNPQQLDADTFTAGIGDEKTKPRQRRWPSVPEDAYYMSGFQGQFVVVIPSKQLVVVRLGYRTPGTDSGIEALLARVVDTINLPNTQSAEKINQDVEELEVDKI